MAVHISQKTESFGARHKRSFIVVIVIGLMMAILAPLQTNYIPFWPRLAYWEILMVSGATIGLGVTEIVERWGRLRPWPWIEVPATGILIALPLTLIVMGAGNMFFGATGSGALRFGYNFGITALISIAITALMHMVNTKPAVAIPDTLPTPAATGPERKSVETRFAQRLPLPMRGFGINALQAEDHYLRAHFDNGQSTLILMRLSDAISELPVETGTQTHRSWWVAKDAVRGVAKADGRATLTLDHAIEAPVSRSFYKVLNDAGWLN